MLYTGAAGRAKSGHTKPESYKTNLNAAKLVTIADDDARLRGFAPS